MSLHVRTLQAASAALRDGAKSLRNEADKMDAQANTFDAEALAMSDSNEESGTKSLPSLDELRAMKARNVSWVLLRRGAMSVLGHEVDGVHIGYDRYKARQLCRAADITLEDLVKILDDNGVGQEA